MYARARFGPAFLIGLLIGGDQAGHRSMDRLMLELSGDYVGMWDITGLSGGQIWVYLE